MSDNHIYKFDAPREFQPHIEDYEILVQQSARALTHEDVAGAALLLGSLAAVSAIFFPSADMGKGVGAIGLAAALAGGIWLFLNKQSKMDRFRKMARIENFFREKGYKILHVPGPGVSIYKNPPDANSEVNGKTQRQNILMAPMELGRAFERLKQDAPAGAYLFANGIHNIRNYVRNGEDVSVIVQSLEAEIGASCELANKLDGGLSVLAQQYAVAHLTRHLDKFPQQFTFEKIADCGSKYRELLPRDSMPPVNSDARIILTKQGNTCLMNLITNIASERDKLISTNPEKQNQYVSDFKEAEQNFIAWFDVREEAASGKLAPHIVRLRNIIIGLGG
jgi:hypothetical protein